MPPDKVITQRGIRPLAVGVLLGCVALGLFIIPLWSPSFLAFFIVWYALLGLMASWFLVLFIRNTQFSMRVQEGRLLWDDGVNPQHSGSVECAKIVAVLFEEYPKSETVPHKVYVVLQDGTKMELPYNCLPHPLERILEAVRAYNPAILKREATR